MYATYMVQGAPARPSGMAPIADETAPVRAGDLWKDSAAISAMSLRQPWRPSFELLRRRVDASCLGVGVWDLGFRFSVWGLGFGLQYGV